MSKVVEIQIWVDPVDSKINRAYGIRAEISDVQWKHATSQGILIREFVHYNIGNEIQALLREKWIDK